MASPLGPGAEVPLDGGAQALAGGASSSDLDSNQATIAVPGRTGPSADSYTLNGSAQPGLAAEAEAATRGRVKRSPAVSWRGINHAVHSFQTRRAVASLDNSASGDAVTIVVTGDSTSLDIGNDALTTFDTLYGMLIRKFRAENPEVTFRFINRGIGGATWNTLGKVASAKWPSWYTATDQPWIDSYIAPGGNEGTNKAPDLVIIVMGTNDNASAGFTSPAAVLAKFANTTLFPTTPDIWLCTSMGRTRDPSFSTPTQIRGALLAQNINRAIVRAGATLLGNAYPRRFGLLDFGRLKAMAVDGFDPCKQPFTNMLDLAAYQGVTALGTTGFTLPPCDGDFDFAATFPDQGGTLLAGRAMRIVVGGPMAAGIAQSLFLVQISGTRASVAYRPGLGVVSFPGIISTNIAAGGDVVIRATARQDAAFLSINGITVWDGPVARGVAPFSPRFFWSADGAPDLVMNLNLFRPGKMLAYEPTMTDRTAWGDNAVGIEGTTGGNQINHPSSQYMQEIVRPVLDAEDFCFAS